MADLRKRFGSLVAAHRKRNRLTQQELAEAAGLSVDMVSKIEVGATGARFPSIERLAKALRVDPAELFTTDIPSGAINRGPFRDLSLRIAALSRPDLLWMTGIVDAALKAKKIDAPTDKNDRASPEESSRKTKSGKLRIRLKKAAQFGSNT